MQPGPPRRRHARPVADAPVDALLARGDDLAKGWLLALLEEAPLGDAPGILAADLSRDGPRVCTAVVRALGNDEDLRRLEPGGALDELVSRCGELAGAEGAEATSRSVDALSAVIWSAIRSELRDPGPDQIAELSERLAHVIERVRSSALRRSAAASPRLRIAPPRTAPGGEPADDEDSVDVADAVRLERVRAAERADPSASRWMGALEAEVARSERSGAPLSLLLIELDDADRIVAVEAPGEVAATFERFAQAVRSVVRREDTLARESDSRAWIIARDTGRRGAWALGARVVGAVKAAPPWRGAPLSVSIGLAVLGENGRDSIALVRAAEQTKFAAAASGLGVDGEARRTAEADEPAS